jgi:hypothetical protein
MQDKKNFEEEMTQHKSPLFAREFLSLYVIDGARCYGSLLRKTEWMRELFPRLYALKLTGQDKSDTCHSRRLRRQGSYDAINLFIYALLGGFLRFKAFLRNSSYRKEGRAKDVFEAVIERGSCVYTSKRYRELEDSYDSMYSSGERFCSNWNQEKS